MRTCQRCQRVVKRGNGDNVETYRCINKSAQIFRQTVTEDICRQCDSRVVIKKPPKQKKTPQPTERSLFMSPENISETSKKERCC